MVQYGSFAADRAGATCNSLSQIMQIFWDVFADVIHSGLGGVAPEETWAEMKGAGEGKVTHIFNFIFTP
jgi:hypothetical protein